MQVVVATLSATASKDLEFRHFKVVVIDEAAQATEPATLVPLVRVCNSASCVWCACVASKSKGCLLDLSPKF